MKIRVLASPKFTNTVMSTSSLPAGTMIGLVAAGLVTGYYGNVTIETSSEALLQFDTAPTGVMGPGTYNAFQMDMSVLKIRGDVADSSPWRDR